MANTMQTWRADHFGEPADVLRLQEITIPAPADKQILVRVLAVGVGLPDVLMLKGVYPLVKTPPVSPGQELVGEVVAVASGSKFAIGDRVMGTSNFPQAQGAFSEYCVMPEGGACLAPAALNDEQAAGFVIPFKTAYVGLVLRCALKAGETLLVLGGAGSSGQAAIQLGKCIGATVIAVASSQHKLDFCKAMGANHVISYSDGDIAEAVNRLTNGRGVDVVFDPVGGTTSEQTANCIARHGRIGLVGYASGAWPRFEPVDMVIKNYSTVGVFAGNISATESKACFDTVCAYAEQGKLVTPVAQVFSFENVPMALELMEKTPPSGKFVVTLG
ncbi:MAG: NADPH:quinone oxidoreductase family protein [Gammaproteobacteria bacterium]|nr:NADPH:quinone oxidoreductase family protein [Gammaproteobacteria bacterium]